MAILPNLISNGVQFSPIPRNLIVPVQLSASFEIRSISLLRRTDRRFVLVNGIDKILGQPIVFQEAVDGSRIPVERLARYPEKTTPANFAVRLTKRLALRKFLRTDKSHLLFLEDDVAFAPEFEEVLADSFRLETDLVFFGGNHYHPPRPTDDPKWLKCHFLFDNHALLFTREGARKVLSMLGEWRYPQSDIEIGRNIEQGRLKALCPPEWVAFQRDTKSDNWGGARSATFAEGAIPYMLGDDLALLDAALNEAKVVVEYGSGASTIHIGNRLRDWGSLVSVEHDPEWFAKVGGFLEDQNLDNVTLLLREPKTGKTIRPWQRFSDREMADYVTAPRSEVGEGTADLVFVDGRQRINCALEAVKLLKSGGLLMVHDFWPRFRYRARLPELLVHYDYLLESPCLEKDQGMALFRRKGDCSLNSQAN